MTARYSRQTVLPEIGPEGQAHLGKARILVVGAGGLGAPVLLYLVAAGVGRTADEGAIGIIDDDMVDLSNLQRQIIYTEADQDQPKTIAAAKRLQALNHETNIVVLSERLSSENVLTIFNEYDIIIDGSDNFSTKYLINDAAVKLGKPVVYGSILGFEGQVAVFSAAQGPCYRCLFPEQAKTHIPNCAEAGTIGSIAGVIGSIQALEACKLALGVAHCQEHGLEPLIGKLFILDARNWDTRVLELNAQSDCPTCSVAADQIVFSMTEQPTACMTNPTKTITLNDLAELWDSGMPITLLDVREISEWATGHLEGAIHLPLGQLLTQEDALDAIEPTTLVVAYCAHGIRSAQAVSFLRSKGYEAMNLLVDWPR